MGWVVFFIGVLSVLPVGWFLLSRTKADRFLTVVGLTMLAPLIWTAGLGLGIGPCEVGSCVTHKQHNLLALGVAAFVVLVLALVALGLLRALAGAVLLTIAAVLGLVSVVKIDTVTAIMFGILAGSVVLYLVLALLPARSRPAPEVPGAAG